MKIILGYRTFSNCTETHPVLWRGHVFDKEDNGKKPAAVTISPLSFTTGRNVNSLEDTFFHHTFVAGSIEERGDQSAALFWAGSNQGACFPGQRLLLLWITGQDRSQGRRKGAERELEKWGGREGEEPDTQMAEEAGKRKVMRGMREFSWCGVGMV